MVRHGPDKAPACPGTAAMRLPSRLQIVQAIPAGSRRARDQRRFLHAVGADPEIAALRYERRRTVLELARVLARHADWHAMTSWRPRALACDEIGSSRDPCRPLSISAYKAARRALEQLGYLGLVSAGWTAALSAVALDDGSSTCPVFVLAIPKQKPLAARAAQEAPVNRPLACSRREHLTPPHAREARAETANSTTDRAAPGLPRVPRITWPAWQVPENRSNGLAAAEVVRSRARLLRRLSPEHWRSIARRFTAAGYSPGDVLHALERGPDGRQHGYSAEVRSVAGWARYRLGLWLDPQGAPLPSPSQLRAAERKRVQAEQSARRAERLRAADRPVDVAGHAAKARELLRERPRPVSEARADPQ
jgi:hypothetical protein